MKKIKSEPFKVSLYAYWHNGEPPPSLCAPATFLEKVTGGWEYKDDAYYNGWPEQKKEDHHWTQTERGLYFTSHDEDVVNLLCAAPGDDPYRYHPMITQRAIKALQALGYIITVRRITTTTITHTLVVDKWHSPDYRESEQIVENKIKTSKYD
jgi:hypothetical protein